MGACATKPKVLKDGAQAPEPEKEENAAEVGTGGDAVPDEKKVVDDESSKRRSLSNLLQENENEGKEPKEGDSAEAEPVKQEVSETVKPAEPELHEPVPEQPPLEPAEKKEEEEKEKPVVPATAKVDEKVELPVVEPTPVLTAVDDATVKAEVEEVNVATAAPAEETVAEKTIEVTK